MSALEDELVGLRAQLERFSLRVSERAVVTGRVVRFIGIFGILSRICFDGSPCYVITLIGAVRATIGGGGLIALERHLSLCRVCEVARTAPIEIL